MSNLSRILSSIALAPDSTELLAMSPLWRQGQLQLSSPCYPKTLAIDCALAPTAMDRSAGLYRPEQQAFAEAILESDDRYDIILIDAAPAFRSRCVEPAFKRLSARAMIILDDAPFWALEANLRTASAFLSRDLQFAAPEDAEPNVSLRQSRTRLDRAGNGELISSESASGNLTRSGLPNHLS